MFFYFFFFLILYILAASLKQRGEIIMVILLIALVACRSTKVGTDTADYVVEINQGVYSFNIDNVFDYYESDNVGKKAKGSSQSINSGREFVFAGIISFLLWIGIPAFAAMKLVSVLIIVMYYKALKMLLPRRYVVYGLLIYVGCFLYFTQFNTLRQSLACSFFFLSIAYFYKKEKVKSVFLMILALFSHSASFIAIFLLPLGLIKCEHNKRYRFMMLTLCVLLFTEIMDNQMGLLGGLFDYLTAADFMYSGHFETSSMDVFSMGPLEKLMVTVFHVIIVACFLWTVKEKKSRECIIIENFWFVGLALYILLVRSAIFARITEFYLQFQFIALPIAVATAISYKKFDRRSKILVLSYILFSYWFYLQNHWYGVMPYEFNI